MLTDKPTTEGLTPAVSPGTYSPVNINVSDSVGALFLGILAVLLLIGWRNAEKRLQRLATQQDVTDKKLTG
jgi:hypothetical protein